MPQDAVNSNLRKSGLKRPVVTSSLKRHGKFPFLEGASGVETTQGSQKENSEEMLYIVSYDVVLT
jgi:hypothetical protein